MGNTLSLKKAPPTPPKQSNTSRAHKCLVFGVNYSGKSTCIKHLASSAEMGVDETQRYILALEDQYRDLLRSMDALEGKMHCLGMGRDNSYSNVEVLSQLQQRWKVHGACWPLPLGADRTEALVPPSHPFEASKHLMDRAVARLGDTPEPLSRQDVLNARICVRDSTFQMTCTDGEVLTGPVREMDRKRNKWFHHLQNVTLVILVVNLGGYCQELYEDESKCSLVEQLDIFEQISSNICVSVWVVLRGDRCMF